MGWQSTSWAAWPTRIAWELGVSPGVGWLGETCLLATACFRLLARFDEGVIFQTLLLLSLLLIWF